MKQLLFLLLFPSLALAQYQGNANQKITLGEQTTADGLVWRGRLADTANLLTNKLDTSVYIVLDTGTRAMWYYRVSTTPKWTRLVDSLNNLQGQLSLTTKVTGVLPVANGGTALTTFTAANRVPYATSATSLTTSSNFNFNGTQLAIGGNTFNGRLRLFADNSNTSNLVDIFDMTNDVWSGFRILISDADNGRFDQKAVFYTTTETDLGFGVNGNTNVLIRGMPGGLGQIGFGVATPTAVLHLKAGTATASTAPLKFTSGSLMNNAESGAMEFNGTNLFFSPSTTRHTVNHGLTGSATLEFLSTNAQNSRDMTITVTGAAEGDVVSIGVPNAAVNANTCYTAWVSAANTVTVRFNNYSSGTVDPASGLFKVFVTK